MINTCYYPLLEFFTFCKWQLYTGNTICNFLLPTTGVLYLYAKNTNPVQKPSITHYWGSLLENWAIIKINSPYILLLPTTGVLYDSAWAFCTKSETYYPLLGFFTTVFITYSIHFYFTSQVFSPKIRSINFCFIVYIADIFGISQHYFICGKLSFEIDRIFSLICTVFL